MEDHLNNKNRLDSEWAALCAYEAEPCAVSVARKVSCNVRTYDFLKTCFIICAQFVCKTMKIITAFRRENQIVLKFYRHLF